MPDRIARPKKGDYDSGSGEGWLPMPVLYVI